MDLILKFCLISTLITCHCNGQTSQNDLKTCFDNGVNENNSTSSKIGNLHSSQLEFALSLLKKVHSTRQDGENIFFSPHSIYQAVMMAYFISDGMTERKISEVLRLREKTKLEVLEAFKMDSEFEKMRSLNGSVSYELINANRLFVSSNLTIRECMQQLFKDELLNVDFQKDPGAALGIINSWISEKTKANIKEILSADSVGEETKLILANAAYFKGLWKSKFLPENTKKEVFFISPSKNTLVPMMRQKGNFKYVVSGKLTAHVLQLPYKGDDISMFIILPPFVSPNGIENLLEKLTSDVIEELVDPSYTSERPVEVMIPKFTVEQKLELVPILESLGIGDLFQDTSDLSKLTGQRDITFNDAVHKAKVSIDEEGTVAAGATAIYTFRSSRPVDPIKFVANHPFVYFIYDEISQSILFIGVFNTPTAD